MIRTCVSLVLLCLLAAYGGGCTAVGVVASTVAGAGETVPARYTGFENQTAAIMVWAPARVQSDFVNIRAELATAIQTLIIDEGQKQLNRSDLKGLVFPYPAVSTVRFQDERSDLAYQPIEQVSMRLGIDKGRAQALGRDRFTRVIHVEVQSMETRFPASRELYRGSAVASLKVVETDGKTAKIAFQDPEIRVLFPQGAQEAYPGDDRINDYTVYAGTLQTLAFEICRRLYDPPVK